MIQCNNLAEFIKNIGETLQLSEPVELRLRFQDNEETDAEYNPKFNKWGGIKRHIITVYISTEFELQRDIKTLIAHEMIHAWQAESDSSEIHGPVFKSWADILERQFGVMLTGIYDPETDTP